MRRGMKIGNARFILENQIGEGSYGEIFSARDLEQKQTVAVKIEVRSKRLDSLQYEVGIYRQMQGLAGIPKLLWTGTEGDYLFMVLELLGSNLDDLRGATKNYSKYTHKKSLVRRSLSLEVTIFLALQMIDRLETFHDHGYIHRDVKPENFVMGRNSTASNVYIIDYGLAKRYKNRKSGEHIHYSEGNPLIGTPRYASINAHLGKELSRRDDIESLAYSLIFLLQGKLPWQGIRGEARIVKYQRILEKKTEIFPKDLCKKTAHCVLGMLRYAKSLHFTQKPSYSRLKENLESFLGESSIKPQINLLCKKNSTPHIKTSKRLSHHASVAKIFLPDVPQLKNVRQRSAKPLRRLEVFDTKGIPTTESPDFHSVDAEKNSLGSCDFLEEEIIEDSSLIKDIIPSEQPLHSCVHIPVANFIQNERFYHDHKGNQLAAKLTEREKFELELPTLLIKNFPQISKKIDNS